jgi:hypothetical protein
MQKPVVKVVCRCAGEGHRPECGMLRIEQLVSGNWDRRRRNRENRGRAIVYPPCADPLRGCCIPVPISRQQVQAFRFLRQRFFKGEPDKRLDRLAAWNPN